MNNYITIIDWLLHGNNGQPIKNEKGDPIEFKNHMFLYDIYIDESPNIVCLKCAQVGMSTLEVLKNHYDAKTHKMDIIYTLPSANDVNLFVGGKVNRIIAQNACMLNDVKDKDSIEQKQIGNSMIYFKGSFIEKDAIMITADRLVNDEKDSSNQQNLKEFEARLQHSKYKQKHVFSHPSVTGFGVDVEWQESDQKEWFITCPHCGKRQFLSWDLLDDTKMSIDIDREIFICKYCKKELSNKNRVVGEWKARKFKVKPKYSGYHISLLMAPWVSAKEILDKFNDKDSTEQFFYNKVLGLPYVGRGNKLTKEQLMANLDPKIPYPTSDDRVVVGIDTGLKLDYVIGSKYGLIYGGNAKDYEELDKVMTRWPKAIAIIDGGGDLIGSRAFHERWKGRCFLCFLQGDKISDNPVWNDKEGMVTVDRNKYLQLLVDEFIDKRIGIKGDESFWYEYWLDWNNLRRIKIIDNITGATKGYKWVRSGRDHLALATLNWRVGMSRFNNDGAYFAGNDWIDDVPDSSTVFMGTTPAPVLIYPDKDQEI